MLSRYEKVNDTGKNSFHKQISHGFLFVTGKGVYSNKMNGLLCGF